MSFIDAFIDWAAQGLQEDEKAQAYLLSRGVSKEQWVKHRLGYTIGEFSVDVTKDPHHNEVCKDREKKHLRCDSCRYTNWSSVWDPETREQHVGRRIIDHIVLPLTDYTGTIVGFQVRSIIQKDYDTFTVKYRPYGYLFGLGPNLDHIWRNEEIWITEGSFDQLVIERLVAPNVVALTTSSVSTVSLRFIQRFVKTINSCLDLDTGGRRGFKALDEWSQESGILVRDIKYPRIKTANGFTKDLGGYWEQVGDVKFARYFQDVVSRL